MITPLSLAAPLSPTEQVMELKRLVAEHSACTAELKRTMLAELAELRARVTELEAQPSQQPRQPTPLAKHNVDLRTNAKRLDEAIENLLAGHPRANELTAPQILQALRVDGYTPLPAVRTVRLHLAHLRVGSGNAARSAAPNIERASAPP